MSEPPRQQPPKKEVALALLEESSMFIHLDPRRPDVQVPKWFMGQPQLVLQVGLNMAIPIPDLKVDEHGISCTLSFNRSPFWCRIPWASVYALVGEDGRGGVWADDVPPEIQQQKPAAAPKAGKKARPKLTVAGRGEADAEGEAAAPRPPAARAKLAAVRRHDEGDPHTPGPAGRDGGAPAVSIGAPPPSPRPAGDDDGIVEDEPQRPQVSEAAVAAQPGAAGEPPAATPAQPAEGESPEGATPEAGARKPKREIPPYLRRIK